MRPCRVVHPHIDTLNESLGQGNVIARNEHDLADESRLLGNLHDLTDEILACLVCRVSLSCEEELYRHLRVVHDGIKPVEIGEEQCSTLVGGETSCKTDGKNVVTECLLDGNYLTWRIVVRYSRVGKFLLDYPDKSLLELFSGIPYLLIGNLVDSFEAFLVVVMCLELWSEYLGVDGLPFLGSHVG